MSFNANLNRRGTRKLTSDKKSANVLSGCNRCIVEDHIILPKNSLVLIFLPAHYDSCKKWEYIFKETAHDKIGIQFGSKTLHFFACKVVTTP